jgi:hypothetical protein
MRPYQRSFPRTFDLSERGLELPEIFCGKSVAFTRLDHQCSITTDDAWSLHIYNRSAFSGRHSDACLSRSIRLDVSGVVLNKEALTFAFSDGSTLRVDMSDRGYDGPEAMQLVGPDGSIVVWN